MTTTKATSRNRPLCHYIYTYKYYTCAYIRRRTHEPSSQRKTYTHIHTNSDYSSSIVNGVEQITTKHKNKVKKDSFFIVFAWHAENQNEARRTKCIAYYEIHCSRTYIRVYVCICVYESPKKKKMVLDLTVLLEPSLVFSSGFRSHKYLSLPLFPLQSISQKFAWSFSFRASETYSLISPTLVYNHCWLC